MTAVATAPDAVLGCTLRAYAEAKHLPPGWLSAACGLVERPWQGRPAVWMPYRDALRRLSGIHVRIAMDGADRFRWARGSRVVPYGLWRLQEARELGYCTIVEGESDCHTLWLHDEPALGIPGASSWRDDWAAALEGVPTIYVVAEPDQGGAALVARLNASPLRLRLLVIALPHDKDVSALYLRDPAAFRPSWQEAKRQALRLSDVLPPPDPPDPPRGRRDRPGRLPGQVTRRGESVYAAVKARIRIEDYLMALGCRLRGRPPRLMTRCPIHDDHQPSCAVNTQLQLWYCHGCGRGGDIWTLDRLVDGPLQAYLRTGIWWHRSTARAGA